MNLRRAVACTLLAAVLAVAATVPAPAAPRHFPMPDGTEIVRDEVDVAPFLAAWKAHALDRERAAATPQTANQSQWDARWYDLALTFTPATSTVSGTVRMKATVVSGPIGVVELDFYSNMVVDAATSAGAATTTSRAGNILTVNLDRGYVTGELVDVTVTYHGNPTAAGSLGFQTVNTRQLIWSLSEPYGARSWWPCKDAPEDKADSVDVHFTCPVECTTVSNGRLVSRVVNGSVATTSWHERYPITTYLVSIASYPYTVTEDWYHYGPTDSTLIRFHNYPESASGYAPTQAKVKDMMAAFASRFGEYPFALEKYGHAQIQFSGGMEHQTCTSLGTASEFVIAHELTHQWWGDLVTCRDFHHVWLNEGFATYGEALWAEANGGSAAYFLDVDANRYLGPGSVYVPDATNSARIFDSNLSYNKGSWVLHMLRHVLGDAVFFQALHAYHTQWGYRSATTEDFRDVCESVSGRDLDVFFQQWVYGEYYPIYRPTWTKAPAGGGWDVTLTLEQIQSWQLFKIPIDVTVITGGGESTFVVPDSLASQTFVLHVDDEPTDVLVDRDQWVLRTIDSRVTDPTFERSLLLVNGVEWATYGTEITTAYADSAFSGGYPFDFWDNFPAPAGGYTAGVPAPIGHGFVPPGVLGHYRNVIWIGNHFNGDLGKWQDTPVLSYLRAGGNLLLMARYGDIFLGDSLRDYLGIAWTNINTTLIDQAATRPGFGPLTRINGQSNCATFDTVRSTPESELLFRNTAGTPNRGTGVIRIPPAGAGSRATGGRLAFVSGRPYRWNHIQLHDNVGVLLRSWFLEVPGLSSVVPAATGARPVLEAARPNPSHEATLLRFTLPRAGPASLTLLDVAGRRRRTLVNRALPAGPHDVSWDGRDDRGAPVAAGLYWATLRFGGETVVRGLVRVR